MIKSLFAFLLTSILSFLSLFSSFGGSSHPVPSTSTPAVAPAPAKPAQPEAASAAADAGWGAPTFEDNFDDPRLAQWHVFDNDYVHYDTAYHEADNVRVEGGALVITTRKEAKPVRFRNDPTRKDRYYSTGYLNTVGTFAQEFGRFEMRAKLPTTPGKSRGIWPAFWLRPVNTANPGEIDIMESYGTPDADGDFDPAGRSEGTVHFDQSGQAKRNRMTPENINLNDGQFHTWAIEWSPAKIDFFIDGVKYHTVTADEDSRFKRNFASGDKFAIRLNTQVGNEYWGWPNDQDTAAQSEYVIDYVRAWAL